MAHALLRASDAQWRPSTQMGALNTDLARQLGATTLGARLWRLSPGQALTRHRHRATDELYVLLEGRGRVRIDDRRPLEMGPLDALLISAEHLRQVFNDTPADQLWLIVGAPAEPADTRRMDPDTLSFHYPDGPRALPPELTGGR